MAERLANTGGIVKYAGHFRRTLTATSNVTWTGSGDGFTYRGIAIVRASDGLIWRYYNYSQDQTVTAGQPVPLFLEGQTIAEISAQD